MLISGSVCWESGLLESIAGLLSLLGTEQEERERNSHYDWEGSQALPSSLEKRLPLVLSAPLDNPTSIFLSTQPREGKLKRQRPREPNRSHASWNLAD